jgi:alpha-D-ribose 1-methylphosphonate 5-triphosphate synthase subunit PhnI
VIDDQTYAFYQLKYSGEGDGDVVGDKRAEARQDREKVARALAKEGVGDKEVSTREAVATRGSRRAATDPAARERRLNRE